MATFFGPQAKVAVVERVNCNFPSLGPDSALWEKEEEIGVCEKKKIGERSEPRGSLGRRNGLPPFSPPQDTTSLADIFCYFFPNLDPVFFPLPLTAESGPRLLISR